jgi:iron complex transport system ATP-binding protein
MLEIRGLHASYGARAVLHGIDLSVRRGELVALAGPNGCGKTTLLRVAAGLQQPVAGRVEIDGQPLARIRRSAVARRVAVVSQAPSLPAGFSALQVALMGRTPHLRLLQSEGRADIEATRAAMQRARCWDLRDRPAIELSGGERQRVVIARALAQEPDLLLLDEPTSHLDIAHQAETFRLLDELRREQALAVLAVVHDLTLASSFASRMAMMHAGRIVADGPAAEVLREGIIEQVYGVAVRVLRHPETGSPVVVPSSHAAVAHSNSMSAITG